MTITGVGPRIFLIAAVCFAAAVVIDSATHDLFAVRGMLGVCFVVIGAVLFAAGLPLWFMTLRRLHGAFKKGTLITDGAYAVCRHPVYALLLVWICGIAMLFKSWLLLSVPVVACIAARLLIRREERVLEEEFGDAYREYKAKVNALLPTLRQHASTEQSKCEGDSSKK